MLTREAWNALLKVLEEPPPRVVFVFATTEPQKIAQTAAPILSRLQRFDLKRIGPRDPRAPRRGARRGGVGYEPDALGMIARAADGGLRDALSLTDQVLSLGDAPTSRPSACARRSASCPRTSTSPVLDLVADGRAADVFGRRRAARRGGGDFSALPRRARRRAARASRDHARRRRCRGERPACATRWPSVAALAPGDLLRMLALLVELEPAFRKSGQQQLLIETLLVRFALLDRTVALEEVLRGLGGGGGPVEPRGAAAPADEVRRPGRAARACVRPSTPPWWRGVPAARRSRDPPSGARLPPSRPWPPRRPGSSPIACGPVRPRPTGRRRSTGRPLTAPSTTRPSRVGSPARRSGRPEE
jgi:DNA polymerase-3 subunit gamma/tau